MNSQLITNKIEELIVLSEMEGEKSVQLILNAVLGARVMGDEMLLAHNVSMFVKEQLLPKAMQMQVNDYALKN